MIHQPIVNFLEASRKAGKALDDLKLQVDDRERKAIFAMKLAEENSLRVNTGMRTNHPELAEDAQTKLDAYSDAFSVWSKKVRSIIEHQEFLSMFDKSLIVMVYGKVKTGKSTLGNFLGGQSLGQLPNNPYKDEKIEFRVVDGTEANFEAKGQVIEQFETKPIEATNCIQYFTLHGFTWVDTPGIGSNTLRHGKLAKEYVANADMVVFLTTSDSPITTSDMDELLPFLRAKRPLLIVVSKSDRPRDIILENNEIEQVWEMKSDKDINDQNDWIEKNLVNAGLKDHAKNIETVFISSYIAQNALENGDSDRFIQSGLPQLFDYFSKVLTESVVDYKALAPKHRFNSCLQEILDGELNSIRFWRSEMRKAAEQVEKSLCEFKAIAQPVIDEYLSSSRVTILSAIGEARKNSDSSEEIQKRVSEAMDEDFTRIFGAHAKRVLSAFETAQLKQIERVNPTLDINEIEKRYKRIYVSREKVGRGLGGAGGGVIGALIGIPAGPIGVFVGGFVGSMIGDAIGKGVAKDKEVEIETGDNADKIAQDVVRQLPAKVQTQVESTIESIEADYFYHFKIFYRDIQTSLDELERNLRILIYKEVDDNAPTEN
ncbi:MAG: dynamin family protein [Candidatus Sumerlaeia bacterium]|nr:dynamin family protein [Candidatus Sumerlaeia bacterium]